MANTLQPPRISFTLTKRLFVALDGSCVAALDGSCVAALSCSHRARRLMSAAFQELEVRKGDRERVVILGSGWAGQQI